MSGIRNKICINSNISNQDFFSCVHSRTIKCISFLSIAKILRSIMRTSVIINELRI